MTGPMLDSFILGLGAGCLLFGCLFSALGYVVGYDAGARGIDRTRRLR